MVVYVVVDVVMGVVIVIGVGSEVVVVVGLDQGLEEALVQYGA